MVEVVVANTVGVLQVSEFVVGFVVTEISGILVDTVYVCLQPVARFVAVRVKTPMAVDVPGLLTGVGGCVGASQPRATPGCEAALIAMVVVLQLTVKVAVGFIVSPVTVTLTEVEHWPTETVFVNTTVYVPGAVTLSVGVVVPFHTPVVLVPVIADKVRDGDAQVSTPLSGVIVKVGASGKALIARVVVSLQPMLSVTMIVYVVPGLKPLATSLLEATGDQL